jgi:hypothetical protein
MALTLTTIPDDFGVGGSGLTPQGSGRPTLRELLAEHKDALSTLDTTSIAYFDAAISFDELGSGATDSILIADFPANSLYLGAAAVAGTQFTGEPDLVFEVGFDGGDTDALLTSTALHETGDGVPLGVVAGAVKGGQFFADASGDGLAVLFTATELDDVTAGSLTVRFFYIPAFP